MTATAAHTHRETQAILKETSFLVAAKYLSQVILIIRGFLIARVLGPGSYGIWTMMRTVFNSQEYMDLGEKEGMIREYPVKAAQGHDRDAFLIQQTAFWWNCFVGAAVGAAFFVSAWVPAFGAYRTELIILAFTVCFNAIYFFLPKKFKAEQRAFLLSKCIYAYAILNTVLGVSLLFAFQIKGLLVGMLITQASIIGWLAYKRYLSLAYAFDLKIALRLLKIGFPVLISMVSFFLMLNVDKIIVFFLLGATNTGYYGLATFLVQEANYIPNSISTVLFPRMMSRFGKTNDRLSIEKYFTVPTAILSVLGPVILGLIYLNIEMVIQYILPRYMPAVGLLRLLIIGLFFSTLWIVPMNILVAFNKQKQLMYFNLILLATGVMLDIVMIAAGFGIYGVGAASVFIFFMLSLGCNIYALYCFKKRGKEIVACLKDIYAPSVYFSGLLIMFTYISISMHVIWHQLVVSLLYIVCALPIIMWLDRKTGLWSQIRSLRKKDTDNNE